MSQDLNSASQQPQGITLAGPQAVAFSSHKLDGLVVENITPPPASRIMDLRRGGSIGTERMRLLRMRLWELRRLGSLKTIAITSALPKDGKSTIATNLASVLSDGKQHKVLVIEGDLHCPGIGGILNIAPNPGLAECLELGTDPFSFIRRIEPLGWYFLPAGTAQGHPTDLVQSDALGRMIEALSPYFDWIIIDTPPVFLMADTMSLCQASDAVLLVVRSGVTPKENVDEAIEAIGSNRIACIMLNGAEDINKSYYKYSSYYGSPKAK